MNNKIIKNLSFIDNIQNAFVWRSVLIFFNDIFIINISLFIAYFLRLEYFINPLDVKVVFLTANIVYFLKFIFLKNYLNFFRFFHFKSIKRILIDNLIFSFLFSILIILFYNKTFFPRSLILIFPMISFFLFLINRYLISLLLSLTNKNYSQKTIVIGFSHAISNLLINYSKIIFYVDDKKSYSKRVHDGIIIINKNNSISKINKKNIDKILIFDKKLFKEMQYDIRDAIINKKIMVEEIVNNSNNVIFKPYFDFNYFFDRKSKISVIPNLYDKKTILITGAGGSIGSGIVKQLLKYNFSRLILVDNSEFNIYNLENIISNKIQSNLIDIHLSDFNNSSIINDIFHQNKIDVVIHAAAYKHVPIIEKNIFTALNNNFFNTYKFIKKCSDFNIPYFCLISSDKAVRPTNIMGATKRLAELGVLNLFDDTENRMIINTVRFGNVINSSGSVLPLFNSQIFKNGPVTITDKRVIRYFMTIEEASSLVLSVYSISKGGETFLLDMGDPVKIYELIKLLIQFSGKRVINDNRDGIDIKEIGLRKGEKLYEELLVDNSSIKTIIKNIYISLEKNMSSNEFNLLMKDLKKAYDHKDSNFLKKILKTKYINYNDSISS